MRRHSGKLSFGTILAGALCLSWSMRAGEYALAVGSGTVRVWAPDAVGYNGKMQGDPWYDRPFQNAELRNVLLRSKIGSFRYPGGTVANYYDWSTGYDNRHPTVRGPYTTANLKLAYDTVGFTPAFVVNMLTGTLQEALDGLQEAENLGLPVSLVEMGNEFYLSDADYTNKWPSGASYGQSCQTWIAAIKNNFPGVRCAVSTTMRTGPRTGPWTSDVLANCTNCDALVVHWYQRSALEPAVPSGDGTQAEQDAQWAGFTASDGVEIMLAQPHHGWQSLRAGNDLPAGAEIWVTEFNLKDSNGAVRQTWANGLFVANQIHALLGDGRVTRMFLHNWLSSNKQAIFGRTNELDHVLTNHGQGSLETTPYEFGAVGQVIRLFAEVMTGATSMAPLMVEGSPKIFPDDYRDYDAIFGWRFVVGTTNRAIFANVSSNAYFIQTANFASSDTPMRRVSGNPHVYVTGENETLDRSTSVGTPPVLRLPPYAIVTFGAEPDARPSGGSPHPPSFVSDPLAKPAAPAYAFYSQSLAGDASDADGDALTFRKISGPDWATVWSDGTLEGRPSAEDVGTNSIVVEVMDAGGETNRTTVELVVGAGSPPAPSAQRRRYVSIEDQFVYSGNQADVVQTADDFLDVRSTASARYSRVPYLKFDVDDLPGTISNLSFHVYSVNLDRSVKAYATSTNWSESTLTWNNAPGFGTLLATKTFSTGWNAMDLTGWVVSTGAYSLALDEQSNAARYYLSSRRGDHPAYLEIAFDRETNAFPAFVSDPVEPSSGSEGHVYAGTLAGAAEDADGHALRYFLRSGPAWLALEPSGGLSGTPLHEDVGTNAWTVAADDGNGGTNTATLRIVVRSAYDDWAASKGLFGDSAHRTADPDSDGVANLAEYALGGDPTNHADRGYVSTGVLLLADGTNAFEYVHARRSIYRSLGLSYSLETTGELTTGVWVSVTGTTLGVGFLDPEFESVTNRISTGDAPREFIRLRIEQ